MKSHGAHANKLRISDILVKSCSLTVKNITSLLILSVALFLVLGVMYDSVEERLSELVQHD